MKAGHANAHTISFKLFEGVDMKTSKMVKGGAGPETSQTLQASKIYAPVALKGYQADR